jgi:O-antigen ligase
VFGFVAILALGLVILFGFLIPDSAVGRMILSAIGGEMAASSNAGRIKTARFALSYIQQNPLIGAGLGNYPNVASGGTVDSSSATFMTAHNTYLELGVELGLPGLLAFVWLLITVFLGAQNLVEQPVGTYWHTLGVALIGVWLSFVVLFVFGGNVVHPKWMTYWWLLAGLQAAARRVLRQSACVKERRGVES